MSDSADKSWTEQAAAVLEDQVVFLEMLSKFYYAPLSQEEVDRLALADFSFESEFDDERISRGFSLMRSFLKSSKGAARLEMNVDFTAAFYGTTEYEGNTAVPYESVFCSEEKILNQKPRAEVFQAYKKYALKLEDKFNTPEDHLSFELQFLGILAQRAARALRDGDFAAAQTIVADQLDFLANHVLNWFEALAIQANKILETDFYRGVLLITAGFVDLAHQSLLVIEEDLAKEALASA